VEHGMAVFMVTRGQWSMIDLVLYLVAAIEAPWVSIWTWAIADYEVEAIGGLLANGRITGARLIVDYSASHRNQNILADWQGRFGGESVRVCKNHAKLARVWNADWRFLARGSMNLNYNPRFEQADVTEGGPDYELVQSIEDEMPIVGLMPSFAEAANASGLGGAFDRGTLGMFAGLPAWKP
jgi:hypothetical protein